MSASIAMFIGETKLFNVAVTQDGAPVDITGWSFQFKAVSILQLTSATKSFSVENSGFEIIDPTGGLATFTVQDGDTTAIGLTGDAVFFFSLTGTEPGGAIHVLSIGQIRLKISAVSVLAQGGP